MCNSICTYVRNCFVCRVTLERKGIQVPLESLGGGVFPENQVSLARQELMGQLVTLEELDHLEKQ